MTETIQPIEVRNLVKEYRRRAQEPLRAVDGLSFTVQRGEIFGLLGPNGAGKTTTIKVLTTLLAPTAGSARVMGRDVVAEPLAVRQNICAVLQENAVELYLTVRDNFLTFARFHGMPASDAAAAMDRVVALFGLREHLGVQGIDLSGGLKRRVQVAKIFMVNKPVVFLDEATTGMDTFNKRATLEAIREEADRGRTIVLTTHVLDEAEELCSRVAIMNHGRIIAQGGIGEVKEMGYRLITVTLHAEGPVDDVMRRVRRLKPHRVHAGRSTVEVTVRDAKTVHAILAMAKRLRSIRSFEVNDASLEDVFVELVDDAGVRA